MNEAPPHWERVRNGRPDAAVCALHKARTPGWGGLAWATGRGIGVLQVATSLLVLAVAGVLALLMRAQLALPDSLLLSAPVYNQVFTMHGTAMVFLFAVPVILGVAVYQLPAVLGARDVPFPRLAAFAYWIYLLGAALLLATLALGVAPDAGAQMLTPLSSYRHSPAINTDFWLLGSALVQISAIAGAVQLLVAVLRTRAPGMSLRRMPVYAWSMLLTALLVVLAFVPMILATGLLAVERAWHWPFFISEKGGDPLLWQRLSVWSGASTAAIVFVPAAGLVSTLLPGLARAPLLGKRCVVAALGAIAAASAALWAYHLLAPALPQVASGPAFAAATALAAGAGVLIFAWIATFLRGGPALRVPTLHVLGFVFSFALAALGGILLAWRPFGGQAQDSYFGVAHLHFVLVGGLLFPLLGAAYAWAPPAARARRERLGRCAFALLFAGLNLAFLPMYVLGLAGMPRRVYTYAPGLGWEVWNLLASVGAAVLAAGACLALLDLALKMRRGLWQAGWPWHIAHAGDGPAPGRARARVLVTSAAAAHPEYAFALPAPTRLPLVVAVATLACPLMLVLRMPLLAGAAALCALGVAAAWLWRTDRSPLPARVDAVRRGPHGRSHSSLATLAVLGVDAAVFAALALAYVHAWNGSVEPWPPREQPLPILSAGVAGVVLWVTSTGLFGYAGSMLGARRYALAGLALALLAHLAALAATAYGFLGVGLSPQSHAYAALVSAVLGYLALHASLLVLTVLYVAARICAGLLDAVRRTSFDNARLLWTYSMVQGVSAAALLYLFPRVAG